MGGNSTLDSRGVHTQKIIVHVEFVPIFHSVKVFAESERSLAKKLLVQIEVANRFACIGGLFGLFDRFLELLLQEVASVLLCFHRLTEDGFAAAVLFLHRLGRRFEIIEHLGLDRSGVGDHPFCCGVDLQDCVATRAGYIES
jgi:hypothetical protein